MRKFKVQQMKDHGVNVAQYPYASFCYGRGWAGHRTADAARKAAAKSARQVARATGGGEPQHFAARTDSGEEV